jgi:2-methylcitrate dehydratase PrpD
MANKELEKFVDFLSSTQLSDFPEKAKRIARWNILDTIGAIMAGGQEQEVVQLTRRLNAGNANGSSTALVDRFPAMEPTWAAFLNGTAGVALEVDPGHRYALGHPSIHVLPAILAMGEREHMSGADLLLSYLVGYEAGSRLGTNAKLKEGFHPHGVFGTVGAAVACAHLGGARGGPLQQAMNIACSFAVTNAWDNAIEGATVRNAGAGMAGHFGILAWEMAASGFTAMEDALAKTFGQLAGEGFSYEKLAEGLGKPFEIEHFYTKLHGSCALIHPSMDAMEEIRRQKTFGPEEIEKVTVRTFSPAASWGAKEPASPLATRFSIPYAAAVLMVTGESMPEYFSPKGMKDARIRQVAQKVELMEDPSFTARLPKERCSEVEVTLRDGRRLKASTSDHRGSYLQPHSEAELEEKFFYLTEPLVGKAGSQEVMQQLWGIEKVKDVSELTSMMRRFRTSA